MINVPVVIAAYDRSETLRRLLNSVKKGVYPDKVKLIISIDGGGDSDVMSIARNFKWIYGEKQVIHHKNNIGLRNHIISCGNLTQEHDGIILLEDDLFVSPYFYVYAIQAMNFYSSDENIAGISLILIDLMKPLNCHSRRFQTIQMFSLCRSHRLGDRLGQESNG